jgi:hypothetical protein
MSNGVANGRFLGKTTRLPNQDFELARGGFEPPVTNAEHHWPVGAVIRVVDMWGRWTWPSRQWRPG